VRELSIALGEVAEFVRDNRELVKSNVDRLNDVTAVVADQRKALAEILDVAPAALSNLSNAYNGASGTLDTRANINELTLPIPVLVCELAGRTGPIPPELKAACDTLAPILDGLVPLPSAAEVITSLQSGQPPPVPGLALPTEPAPPAGLSLPAPAAPTGQPEGAARAESTPQAEPTGRAESTAPAEPEETPEQEERTEEPESGDRSGLPGLFGGDR
jgi:hypothetical protein